MNNPDDPTPETAKEVISWGTELVGSSVGGGLGFFAGGPLGAAAGAAVGTFFGKALKLMGDYAHRQLSTRERARIGAAFTFALAKVQQHVAAGRVPREDGFFESAPSGRSAADTILEGAVQKCRVQYEEQKCSFIANIYANVAFDPHVSISNAVLVLELAERLTYRQLRMIALAGLSGDMGLTPFHEFSRQAGLSDSGLRWEWQELYNQYQLLTETDHIPKLTRLGRLCFVLMGLGDIPKTDLQTVWSEIQNGLRWYDDGSE